MTEMMVKIIVEVLDILGTATKEMKQSRASEVVLCLRLLEAQACSEKFLKSVAGINKLDGGLKRLDKMTNEEARMATAEMMRIAHDIKKTVKSVERSSSVLSLPRSRTESYTITGTQLRESLRKWQSPSDPSTNHNFACERQHGQTTEWLCKGDIFRKWKAAGSLLWIHGKRMLLSLLMVSVI